MNEQTEIFEVDLAARRGFTRYLNKHHYNNMTDAVKKQLHESWRADPTLTIKDVQTALDLNMDTYYKELDRLGVAYQKKPQQKKRQRRQKLATEKKLQSSCTIFYEGAGDPQQLLDLLVRIEGQINDKAESYKFSFKIEEFSL